MPVNPNVYQPHDGHLWEESKFPTLRDSGKCALCGALGHQHVRVPVDTLSCSVCHLTVTNDEAGKAEMEAHIGTNHLKWLSA